MSFCLSYVGLTFNFFLQGVATGVGLCANSHLEGTLAKLDEFGKSDAFKKSPSIFNLLKVKTVFRGDFKEAFLAGCKMFYSNRSVMRWKWRR